MKKIKKQNYVDLFYKEQPKLCDPKDFWGQVKRSVDGKPISNSQIIMIENAVDKGLKLSKSDKVLDIGCGNGALSALFFKKINKLVGVDFSEYLIGVAKENFEMKPDYTFHLADAYEFIVNYEHKEHITKVLCYGTFAYFDFQVAKKMLRFLNESYKNVSRVYIGNLPNKDKAENFYYKDIDYTEQIDDAESPIGIWRSEDEMKELAADCGWGINFHKMPKTFQGSHYRYDVILKRKL